MIVSVVGSNLKQLMLDIEKLQLLFCHTPFDQSDARGDVLRIFSVVVKARPTIKKPVLYIMAIRNDWVKLKLTANSISHILEILIGIGNTLHFYIPNATLVSTSTPIIGIYNTGLN